MRVKQEPDQSFGFADFENQVDLASTQILPGSTKKSKKRCLDDADLTTIAPPTKKQKIIKEEPESEDGTSKKKKKKRHVD